MRRILFEIPLPYGHYLPIHSFGVMVALGFLAALWVALERGRREKLAKTVIWDVWTGALVGGVLGARLLYVVEHWDFFARNPAAVPAIWKGGLVWYGGMAGAALVVLVYLRYRRQPALPVIDAVIPAAMVGLAFGRIGCFLNGCCFGRMTSLPWGVSFPRFGGCEHFHSALAQQFSPAFDHQVATLGLDPSMPASDAVHPTQLYSSAAALIIFLLLTTYYPRRKRSGEVFWLMLVLYGTARFLVEGLRTNTAVWMGLSLAQVMSLVTVPFALGVFLHRRRQAVGVGRQGKDSISSKGKSHK